MVIDTVPGVVVALAFLGAPAGNGPAGLGAVAMATSLDDAIEVQRAQQLGLANLERGAKGKPPSKPVRSVLRDRPLRSRLFPFLRR